MPEPTAADCMEAILQIATREDLSDEERKEAMNAVAEAAGDPAKMQALLAGEQEEETPPETEADLSLVEGPTPRPPVEYDPPPAERSPHIRSVDYAATFPSSLNAVPEPYAAESPKAGTTTEIVVPDKEAEPDEEDEDDEEDSLIEVPDVPQDTDYTCWPAAAMSVGLYHGVGPKTLAEWTQALGTTEEYSTDFQKVADYFESLGCEVEENVGMDFDDLEEYWRKNWPVLLAVSEYGPAPPKAKFQYGHCLCYIGGPKYGFVFCQDPSESNIKQGEDSNDAPGRVMIEEEDFLRQWWDRDRNGRKYSRFGIAVGPPKDTEKGMDQNDPSLSGEPSPDVLDRPEVREAAEALLRAAGASDAEIAPAIEEAKGILSGEEKPNPMKKQLLALADRAERDGDKASAALYRKQALTPS